MASAQPLTDHDQIREWAEQRGGRPACVKGTGAKNDTGMIRLNFPGFSGEESLQEISWDEWFRQFDENNLALVVEEKTSRGQKSNFNKLVSRETASSRSAARKRGGSTKQARGTPARVATRGARKRAAASRGTARTAGARKSTPAGRQAIAADRGTTSGARKKKSTGTRAVRARKAAVKRK